jgi:hypothetical protein
MMMVKSSTPEKGYQGYEVEQGRENYEEIVPAGLSDDSYSCVKTKSNHSPGQYLQLLALISSRSVK